VQTIGLPEQEHVFHRRCGWLWQKQRAREVRAGQGCRVWAITARVMMPFVLHYPAFCGMGAAHYYARLAFFPSACAFWYPLPRV